MTTHSRAVACVALALSTAAASADSVRLRSGAELRGRVVSRPGSDIVSVQTPAGLTVSAAREEVVTIRRRTADAEEYVTRSRRLPQTADAFAALARWCAERRLPDERLDAYRTVLRLDPDHEAANRALGREKLDGRWVDADAVRQADGLIEFDGKWVSPAEAEFLAEHRDDEAARRRWYDVVREIERRLASGTAQDTAAALEDLRQIDDYLAIDALIARLGSVPAAGLRMEVVEALARMAHYEAVRPLMKFAVSDEDALIRQRAVGAVPPELQLTAGDVLVRSLRSSDNLTVRRAAEALTVVGTKEAVPQLLAALITTHKTQVRVLKDSPTYTVGGRGGIGMTRDPVDAQTARMIREASFPFGANVILPDSAFITKTVPVAVQNESVRTALVAITGEDFGFDEDRWRRWWRREGRLSP